MADAVKWSTLFPKTGGSGRGGAFTGKVFTPAMSPYSVVSGDRLVIPKTDQALVIDPSGLKPDDAFQVIDASRNFDKSPVTIKGDKVSIQIVGTGNDLVLDMIGAGNLWEFIVGDDGNNGKQLLVADSPGYTGDLPGGGGSAPASGGDNKELTGVVNALDKTVVGMARWFMVDKKPNDTTATSLGAASKRNPDTGTIENVGHGTFVVDKTTGNIYYWPDGQTAAQGPLGDTNDNWQTVASGGTGGTITVDSALDNNSTNPLQNKVIAAEFGKQGALISGFDAQVKALAGGKAFKFNNNEIKIPQYTGSNMDTELANTAKPGDFIRVAFDNLTINADPNQSIRSQDAAVLIPEVDPNNLLPIRIIRDGYKPAGPNAFLSAKLTVRMAPFTPADPSKLKSSIMGTWDAFDPQADQATGFEMDDPGEFVELTPVMWTDSGGGRPMPVWVITSSAYDEGDTDVIETTTDVTAKPGQTIIARDARPTCRITIPAPDLDDPAPIVILHHPMDGQTTPFTVPIMVDKVNGTFRGKEHYMTSEPAGQAELTLVEPGDWVKLEPFGANADKFWVITASGGSSDDTVLVEDGFTEITAVQGQTVLVRKNGIVNLPAPDIYDSAPITVVIYPEVAKDAFITDKGVAVQIKTVKTDVNRGIIGRFGHRDQQSDPQGDPYYVNSDHLDMSTGGSWVRFEACGGPNDPFWLITGSGSRLEGES